MNITILGNDWTAEQLESLARGLRQAERGECRPIAELWDGIETADDQMPDTWEIEEPMRFQSFAHMPLSDRGKAECITVLAYHLWQLEERLTGGDGSHKGCDPLRIEWDGAEHIVYSYVFAPLEWNSYKSLADIETALLNLFAERLVVLLANGRKREGVKW
ncbi:MAG: hypothetical protein IPL28_26265 [Chloroflexi bacterium]|nr:hypothetical protein [Chloroflexota bacterium]